VIHVLVLTGFLGSGKTTLLRHLLRQPEFSRTAVIINEFGEIGLDHELVEASTDSFIELNTGCLCCKLRSDLVETLGDMLRRRDHGTVPPFTRVVIETSGLADPAPILHTLMTEGSIAGRLGLGGVATTVDAVTGVGTLRREAVSLKQVALADRIILTKTDVEGTDRTPLRGRIAELNPAAPVTIALHGRVDPGILDPGVFTSGLLASEIAGAGLKPAPTPLFADGPFESDTAECGGEDGNRRGGHHTGIQTFTIVRDAPIHAVTLTLFLEALAEHCGSDLLRLKGIINVRESPAQPAVIHGVQHVFHPLAWLPRWPSDDRRSRMVLIARGIPPRWVEVLLAALDEEVAIACADVTPSA
jgi:G3E family GTPase